MCVSWKLPHRSPRRALFASLPGGPRPNLEYQLDESLFKERWNLSPCLVLRLQTYADTLRTEALPRCRALSWSPSILWAGRESGLGSPGHEARPVIGCGAFGSPSPP